MKQGIIYAIYNKETETYYIGQTIHELNKRWKEHIYQSIKMNPAPLYKSMRKYGLDKFNIKVLEECPIDNLDEKETYWINEHNSYSKGYNQTTGAGGQYKISEDVKDRISKTMSGVEKTPEHIENIIKGMKRKGLGFTIRGDGKHHCVKVKTININTLEETFYDSITECAIGLNVSVPYIVRSIKNGWKIKEHRIIKLEDKSKSYAIYGIDKITNKVRYTFPSIRSAGRELGSGGDSGCRKSLKHPHKYTWKGCYWFYE